MGSSSSKLAALPQGTILEVFRDQQARAPTHIKLAPGSIKDKVQGLSSGRKSATWVKVGSEKRYMLYSYLVDMSKTGYRRQYICSADGATTYCFFERTFNPYLKSHCYRCVAFDNSRTLFEVSRGGLNDLIVEISNSYDPANTMWNGTVPRTRPTTLYMDYRGGVIRWMDPVTGQPFDCGKVSVNSINLPNGVDQILFVVLSAIVKEIKELDGLLRLAQYASPVSAKKGVVVAMREANHLLQTDPSAQRKPSNTTQVAIFAAGDLVSGLSKGQSFSDSAYASANNSIASSREASRVRNQSQAKQTASSHSERSQSRGRHQENFGSLRMRSYS